MNNKNHIYKVAAICFWLLIWEISSRIVNEKLFMASPAGVFITLITLIKEISFWETIVYSTFKILVGFFLGLVVGTVLAVFSGMSRLIYELLLPVIKIIKATPVVSFIILALIWFTSQNLSVLISFLMVVPIVYSNVLQGIKSADKKLLQMAVVYRLGITKKLRAIYIPAVMPFLTSAITVGLGYCFKAGIAAEVIGTPVKSIGERLYEAKLYFMTEELFAWTTVIILLSIVLEKIVLLVFKLGFNND